MIYEIEYYPKSERYYPKVDGCYLTYSKDKNLIIVTNCLNRHDKAILWYDARLLAINILRTFDATYNDTPFIEVVKLK